MMSSAARRPPGGGGPAAAAAAARGVVRLGTASGLADGPPIKQLIHISDIHIRLGDRERCRYDEYTTVMRRFCETIADLPSVRDGSAVIVITGDLFHNKGRLEATTVELYLTWMEQMLTLCPVILISGNHDYRQESSEMAPYPDIAQVMSRPFREEMSIAPFALAPRAESNRPRFPLFYLEHTGHYVFRNLGIGTVVVRDTLKAGNTRGLADALPAFPSVRAFRHMPEVTQTVALFHGSVSDRPLPTGWTSYPMAWFAAAGYDRLLLGDIHTQMVKTTACLGADGKGAMTWGYPGSLIQQEFCEATFGHGYLLWDLAGAGAGTGTAAVTKHHVYNEYGMVTLRRKAADGQIMAVLGARKIVPIDVAAKMDDFPYYPKVRVLGKPEDRDAIVAILLKLGIKTSGVVNALPVQATDGDADTEGGVGGGDEDGLDLLLEAMEEDSGSGEDDAGAGDAGAEGAALVGPGRLRRQQRGLADKQREVLADLNSPKRWCEYLEVVAPDLIADARDAGEPLLSLIQTPDRLAMDLSADELAVLSADTVGKIKERNATLAKACEEYRAIGTRPQTELYRVTLKKMAWSYAMCFGIQNVFSFDDMTGQIVLLNGPNAIGKSSFLDVICIGLFGEPTRLRAGTGRSITSAKMIHDSRPPNSQAMNVKILFEMEGHGVFEIVRSFNKIVKEERGALLAKPVLTAIYHVETPEGAEEGDPPVKVLVVEGTTSVDAWVARYIGTIDDVLMSTIIQQVDTASFFHLKPDEQKALLDRSLRLESISVYGKLLHEAILAHAAILARLTTAIETLKDATAGGGGAGGGAAGGGLEAIQKDIAELDAKRAEHAEKRDALIRTLATLGAKDDAAAVIKNAKQKLEKALGRLETFSDLTEDDRATALMIKGEMRGRWEAIQKALAEVAAAEGGEGEGGEGATEGAAEKPMTKEEVAATIAELTAARQTHAREMPTTAWTDAELKANEKEIARWKKRGGDALDPDVVAERLEGVREAVAALEREHQALLVAPMRRPTVAEPAADAMLRKVAADAVVGEEELGVAREKLRTTTEKWSAAVKAAVQPRRPREGLADWQATYAAWQKDGGASDETLEELEARVKQYAEFIAAFERKEAERQAILAELDDIAALEAEMADLPFNPECWACQKQPTRALLERKRVQKADRTRALTRIQRYIAKCCGDPAAEAAGGSAAYVARLRGEMAEAEEAVAGRRRYEDARERMEAEAAAWAAAADEWAAADAWRATVAKLEAAVDDWKAVVAKMEWIAWRQWSERETATRERLDGLLAEVARDEAALAEYAQMSARMEQAGAERAARDAMDGWTAEGARLDAALARAERTARRLELLDQKAEVEAAMSVNGELFDRLMDWERTNEDVRLLKAAIAREDLARANSALEAVDARLEKAREALGRVRQEETERLARERRAKGLRDIYKRLSARKDRLARMEEKFVGGAGAGATTSGGAGGSSDGFLEWIYKKRIIPLLEREVNRFLSLIDDFRLKIDYRAKRLIYTVQDRGNEPTLEHVSGYQRYIVGLAMRAGLSRISAVGQNLSLLCLDESFVACDAVNIQKTEMILRNIMAYSGQTHLIITSHLDVIRDAADRIVDIKRDGKFSFITFGDAYPNYKLFKDRAPNTTMLIVPSTPRKSAASGSASAAAAAAGAATDAESDTATTPPPKPKPRGRPKKTAAA